MRSYPDTRRVFRLTCVACLLGLVFTPIFSMAKTSSNDVNTSMLVSTTWLASHLHDPNLVILCVADNADFYSGGHVPGARLIRSSELMITRDGIPNELPPAAALKDLFERAGVNNSSRIVLYGERSGILAARAYFTLDYLGVAANAALLDGGIEKWRAKKRRRCRRSNPARSPSGWTRQFPSTAPKSRRQSIQNHLPSCCSMRVPTHNSLAQTFLKMCPRPDTFPVPGISIGATRSQTGIFPSCVRHLSCARCCRRAELQRTNKSSPTAAPACSLHSTTSSRSIWDTQFACTTAHSSIGPAKICRLRKALAK